MVNSLIKKNDILKLNIEDVTLEGVGIGRYNGIAVFVPQTAVGDIIEAKIIKVKKSYLIGKTENILVPSEDRIVSDCAISRQCGGCAFRHISYEAELKIKEKHVKDCLERIGGFKGISVDSIIGASEILHYRNKAQIPFGYSPNGNLISGFYASHSHRIVDCKKCLLQPEIFDKIVEFIKGFMREYGISAYNEVAHKGLVRHIYLRSTKNAESVMVCMVLNGNRLPHSDIFIKSITSEFKNIKSIFVNVNKCETNVILGEKFIKLFGEDYLIDSLCGKKFIISPDSFYQVNHDQTEVLYNIAKSVLGPQKSDNLLDLYCGVGTIGLSMAERVASLCGVEIVESAVKNAIRNAEINEIKNAKFFCGDSSDVVRKSLIADREADIVIVDPPRKGCSDELINDIFELSPKKVLYISCNPATLAKDLQKICSDKKYEICKVVPVDMFPRTAHVETVVLLLRNSEIGICGGKI